jgi:thioredoxin reductase/ferredoxin
METTVPLAIGLVAAALLCLGALVDDRRARIRRRRQRDEPAQAVPLLHSINDDRCIGCEACVDVCPTEVLDLVEHKVRVARFSDCVQCEQCANACPTQALVMYRQGTTPRMLTVPELDEHFQTGVPGQYLIGEVAGKPLVKNAANLGRAVVEHIARTLAQPAAHGRAAHAPVAPGVLDVLIVGSGPGGLSAGLTCLRHKLSCLVLEKEHVISATVSRYPKGKHFMAEPSTAQNVSYLPVFDGSKEELVAAWKQVIDGVQLPIRLGEAVETVARGDDGLFTIKSTVGTYRARTVVLGTGLRGKPRLLAVPGANLEKVQSLLDDPAEFAGTDVLVVGGGDSAIEGAMSLADAGARVTLSYRGDGFKRCKQGNQKRLAEMTAAKRLAIHLESNVHAFTPDHVTITLADKSQTTLPNYHAFVLIGADTPVAWLEANHVRFVERPHLYALGSSEDVVRRFAPDAAPCPTTPADALAILLDRPLPRSPVQRVRSVAQHLREELWDVVTSVSSVFHLTDLEPTDDAARAAPLRPRSPTHRPARHDVTDEMPSLRAIATTASRAFDHTTDEMSSLRVLEQIADAGAIPSLRSPGGTHVSPRVAIDPSIIVTDEIPSLVIDASLTRELPALKRRGARLGSTPPSAHPQSAHPSADDVGGRLPVPRRTLRSATDEAAAHVMPPPGGGNPMLARGSEGFASPPPRSVPSEPRLSDPAARTPPPVPRGTR